MAERNTQSKPLPPLIKVWPDAALLYGCGRAKAYEMARSGAMPVFRDRKLLRAKTYPILAQLEIPEAVARELLMQPSENGTST